MDVSDWTPPQLDFIDPRTTPFVEPKSRGNLPHLYKPGGFYFVTFRVWDAVMPPGAAEEFRTLTDEAAKRGDAKIAERIAAATEPTLRSGSCPLRKIRLGTEVEKSLLHFHNERYAVLSWCVMPNHAHVVYAALGEHSPDDIQHSWKSYTATRINRLLEAGGQFWEHESFDHLIRTEEACERFIRYVELNPVAAGLVRDASEWPLSSARLRCR